MARDIGYERSSDQCREERSMFHRRKRWRAQWKRRRRTRRRTRWRQQTVCNFARPEITCVGSDCQTCCPDRLLKTIIPMHEIELVKPERLGTNTEHALGHSYVLHRRFQSGSVLTEAIAEQDASDTGESALVT